MKPDSIIGIDCGTSSCKAIVWNKNGQRVSEGRSPLPLLTPRPLWHEQPAGSWWDATVDALQEAIRPIDPARLAAVCITHQRETFVPVDEGGFPLRNAILWMDERAGAALPAIEVSLGKERFHQITGKPLSGNLSVSKIVWLRENEPQVFQRAARFLDTHAFLACRLTGQFITGSGCADPMGLYDMSQQGWSGEILRATGLSPDRFPEVIPSGTILGEVSAQAAVSCGLPAGLPVVAGLGDGQASGLGAGVAGPGVSYLSLGTSVISGTFSTEYLTNDQCRTMVGGMPGSFFLETVILGGAYTVDWFVEHFAAGLTRLEGQRSPSIHDLDGLAQNVPPGCQGLVLVPYWNSAMNPYWDAQASGIVVGWRGIHRLEHLYRAILEGIAFEQRLHTEGVSRSLGQEIHSYLAAGGGAASDLWCQILADVTGRQLKRLATAETASLGAAILASAAGGMHPGIAQAALVMSAAVKDVFEPDSARHAFYTRLYEDVYRPLYPALRGVLGRLSEEL